MFVLLGFLDKFILHFLSFRNDFEDVFVVADYANIRNQRKHIKVKKILYRVFPENGSLMKCYVG